MNYCSGSWSGYTGKARKERALLTKGSWHHSWNRRVAAEAASFTLGNEQKLFASIPKTGLNLLRKFSSAMTAANSTNSSSVKCFFRRWKDLSVTRLPVYVIRSASSSASFSRTENTGFFFQSPSTASTFSAAAPLCIAPDALLSIQYGQPLI